MSFEIEWKRMLKKYRKINDNRSWLSKMLYYPDWLHEDSSSYKARKIMAQLFFEIGRLEMSKEFNKKLDKLGEKK